MAVIQISKIQQRRGKKNSPSGIPQLSSAEFAWSIDTQELFIGNGSIAEGAPYVGNTKVLTEHDNILELAYSYRYEESDFSITESVFRPLQDKIDEIQVSVLDFGADPDGSSNSSPAFETAISQLFRNTNEKFRKVLIIPNGYYVFTTPFSIPPNVILRGENRDETVLDIGSAGIEVLGYDPITDTLYNRFSPNIDFLPHNINLENLTIQFTAATTNISFLRDSKFINVKWKSTFNPNTFLYSPILASQSYDLSGRIQDGGAIQVVGDGVTFPGITESFDTSIVQTLQNLRDALEADPQFTVNFEASQVAESLVITAKSSSGLPVEGILNFFDVRSKLSGIDDFISVVPIPTPASTGVEAISSAVTWENDTFNKRTTNVHFDRCVFEDVPMAIKCFQNRSFETEIKFTACEIVGADTGVFLRGTDDDLAETEQKNNWKFFDCRFENISKEAIWSTRGIGVTVDRSEVKNCGNNNLSPIEPSYNIFKFGTRQGNVIINTQIDRHQIAGITLDTTKIPVSEASNAASVEISNVYFSPLYKSSTPYMLASFSTTNRYTLIDYVLELSGYVRKGTLTIVIDDALAGRTEELAIADNFTYSSELSTSTGGSIMTSFEFSAILVDNETDDSSQTDTFLLKYVNPLGPIDPLGTISYRLRFGV